MRGKEKPYLDINFYFNSHEFGLLILELKVVIHNVFEQSWDLGFIERDFCLFHFYFLTSGFSPENYICSPAHKEGANRVKKKLSQLLKTLSHDLQNRS